MHAALFLLFIFNNEGASDTAMGTESDDDANDDANDDMNDDANDDDEEEEEEEEDRVIYSVYILFLLSWVLLARFMTDAELLPRLTPRTSRQVNTTVGMYI